MLSFIPLSAVALAAAAAFFLRKQNRAVPDIFLCITFLLPFAAGGFHSYVSAVTAVLLTLHLLNTAKKQGYLLLTVNWNTLAVVLVLFGYCITPFWAADKGMAVFGILRYLPLVLYILALMQLTPEQKRHCLDLIPMSGMLMTVSSCLMLLIPGADAYLTVSNRLAGCLQYPNTFAAFLLAGLILQYSKDNRNRRDLLTDAVLVMGILLSGSKTVYVLLAVSVMVIVLIHRKAKILLILLGILAAAAALRLLNSDFMEYASTRFTSESFLLRLLYYKDVLPMILKNPFGYGYMGYRALEGTFQTGGYYVTYVHNGLLQLLFEIGWLPSLAMAAAFVRALFSRKTVPGRRLLLFALLAHCMLDFDLQFFIFWAMLLSYLDFETGKQHYLRWKTAGRVLASLCIVLSLWLGAVDLSYSCGKTDITLRLLPCHTDSLSVRLRSATDVQTLNETADKILKVNPTFSLAYSAKANAALASGDVLSMMTYKEQAIFCSPYTAEEYMDYFDKLHAVSKLYLRNGDDASAEYCERKIVALSRKIREVQESTDPLTEKIGDYTVLKLPIRYRLYMRMLNDRYPQT